MTSAIPVANETNASASRVSKDGGRISYEMTVIQQPERARACGSGAKSSADRRPVDPPPIVRLRVLKNGEDVTFSYNANFFLFATLENARAIAHGRVPPTPATVPVLTGTPVAGMAYLDRPTPAGYFVFPDLSVRHEGKYRLGFSLYEELKKQEDMDAEQISNLEVLAQTANPAHVSHRLEVKSEPFTVFSAKKFPGLTESTVLSRLVAEQGCRVRIRRDVRMRRRGQKGGPFKEDMDGSDSDSADRKHSQTPDAFGRHAMPPANSSYDSNHRPRSVSDASLSSYAMPPRRPSVDRLGQGHQQPYSHTIAQPALATQGMYPPSMPYSASQQQQQQYHVLPAQPVQPSQVSYHHQPSQSQYAHSPQHRMAVPGSATPYSYGMSHQQSQPVTHQQPYSHAPLQPSTVAYDQTQHDRHNSIDHAVTQGQYRRASMSVEQNQPQSTHYAGNVNAWSEAPQTFPPPQAFVSTSQSYVPVDSTAPYQTASTAQNNWNPNSNWESRRQHSISHITSGASNMPAMQAPRQTRPLAPLADIQPVMPPPTTSVCASSPTSAQSSNSPGYSDANTSSSRSSIIAPSAPTFPSSKRTYSATFDTHHIDQPLRYGARPDPNGFGYVPQSAPYTTGSDDGMDNLEDMSAMSYRRADGTERRRRIPIVA